MVGGMVEYELGKESNTEATGSTEDVERSNGPIFYKCLTGRFPNSRQFGSCYDLQVCGRGLAELGSRYCQRCELHQLVGMFGA